MFRKQFRKLFSLKVPTICYLIFVVPNSIIPKTKAPKTPAHQNLVYVVIVVSKW